MQLKGYRKLISALTGVVGIVLVSYFGVPQVQVDNLIQVLTDVLSAAVSAWAIAVVIWAQIAAQGRVDVAEVEAHAQPTTQRGLPEFTDLQAGE